MPPPSDYPPHRDSHSLHHQDQYPPHPDTFPPRVPPPSLPRGEESRHHDYGSEGRYGEPPAWESRQQGYKDYEDSYRDSYDDDYYQKSHHYDNQGYQDHYRHEEDTYSNADQRYREDYQKHRQQHQQQHQQQPQQPPQHHHHEQEEYPQQEHYRREEYADSSYREEKYQQEDLDYDQPKRNRDIKSRLGGRLEHSQNTHNLQVKVVQTTAGQDQEPPAPTQQEGQKIQTVQQRPKTSVSRKFRRITRRSPHGAIMSITRIPVDEDGNQIGPQITEYEATDASTEKPDSAASLPPFQQSRVSVVKNSRQIVRKVPVARQPQQQQQQPQHQVKLREIPSMDQGGGQQQQAQQVKVVKRTIVSSGEMQSQMGSAGRRIVTTTSAQAMGRSGPVLRGTIGIRRVVTAGSSASNEDLPTVHLCDLPSNLTLSDINQIVADAGVGQPVSVDYIPGSRECMLRFQVAEVAARFSQKINRRMVNMSFIKASAIL